MVGFNKKYPPTGPIFVLIGPGTKKGQKEIENWPSHYRRSEFVHKRITLLYFNLISLQDEIGQLLLLLRTIS